MKPQDLNNDDEMQGWVKFDQSHKYWGYKYKVGLKKDGSKLPQGKGFLKNSKGDLYHGEWMDGELIDSTISRV